MLATVLLAASGDQCSSVQAALERVGLNVRRCPLAASALVEALESRPSAVFLDARSDFARAAQLCQSLRSVEGINSARVVAVTSPGAREDCLRLFEAGADDCWTVSGDSRELLQRAKELVRSPLRDVPRVLRFGEVVLDPDRFTVTCRGRTAKLTAMQLKLLAHLMANPGMVFSHQRLLEEVWDNPGGDERMVRACVLRLRRALGSGSGPSGVIETVRGGGYAFNPHRACAAPS